MALLRTERLSTIRNCTSSELETAAIERHKERFIFNGFFPEESRGRTLL